MEQDLPKVNKNNFPAERLTFRKDERLRHKSLVDSLFKKGKTIYEFPLRMTWLALSETEFDKCFKKAAPENIGRIQMLVTIPKKKRKLAVDRVSMRRKIREAYRLNRLPLKKLIEDSENTRLMALAFIYIDNKNSDYHLIERKMRNLFKKLMSNTFVEKDGEDEKHTIEK